MTQSPLRLPATIIHTRTLIRVSQMHHEWPVRHRRLCQLALLSVCVLGCTGCWPGRLVAHREFAEVHPSVRWVYHAGGQIGWFVWIPIAGQHDAWVEPGEHSVIVSEIPSFDMAWHVFSPVIALDPRTGRSTIDRRSTEERQTLFFEWDQPTREYLVRGSNRVTFGVPDPYDSLFVYKDWDRSRRRVCILKLRKGRLGAPQGYEVQDHQVIALGKYVVCIDRDRLFKSLRSGDRPGSEPVTRGG